MAEIAAQAPLAFAAGMISVLSPCVLPLMPGFLALALGLSVAEVTSGAEAGTRRRILGCCAWFLVGFTTVFVVMGVSAFAPALALRTWRAAWFGLDFGLAQLAGVGITLFGLSQAGLFGGRSGRRPAADRTRGPGRSGVAALLVGAGFGLGWSPCIGPILASVLSLAAVRETATSGALLLVIYSVGLSIPFLLAGRGLAWGLRSGPRTARGGRVLEVVSGSILAGAGLLLALNQFTRLNRTFAVLGDWILALEGALL